MEKNRLEAFSDGVIAIIITIMVLELKVPHGGELADLKALANPFMSYVLSFVFLGIYWNNHHHLLQASECVNGWILWANLHLLFWLSLIPFATAWLGEHGRSEGAIALYGVILFFSGFAFWLLCRALVNQHGKNSDLGKAIGGDVKGLCSMLTYLLGIALAFIAPWVSQLLYIAVAVVWLVPDRRITRVMELGKCD